MYSIQEMVSKTIKQRKDIKANMDNQAYFDYSTHSIFTGQTPAVQQQLKETLENVSLREFLAKSGVAGIAGAAYLIPDVIHTNLVGATFQSDKVPLFTAEVVDGWSGGDLVVNVAVRQPDQYNYKWTLQPQYFLSGGQISTQTIETIEATIKPKGFSVNMRAGKDLLEDSRVNLIDWHIAQAGQQIGQFSTDLAIADLKAAADGTGVQCVVAASAGTTTSTQLLEAIREVGSEMWHPNTLICTYEAWADTIAQGAKTSGGAAGDYYEFASGINFPQVQQGYDAKFHSLDVIFNNSGNLFDTVTTGKMTKCVSLVLDRNAALLCGRKRWLRIENYSNPVRDIGATVITCRQDCVTLHKDASAEITET